VKWFVRKNHNQRLFQEQKLCGWMNDMILISNEQISCWKIGWNSILILLLNSKKASLICVIQLTLLFPFCILKTKIIWPYGVYHECSPLTHFVPNVLNLILKIWFRWIDKFFRAIVFNKKY
jgi:hypothetical protein